MPRRIASIETQHSASWSWAPPVSSDGNAAHARVVLRYDDGSEEIVFTGPEFDELEHLRLRAEREGA